MKGYKRKRGGAWRLEASAGFDPSTGRYRRVTETFHGSGREADERLAELVREVGEGFGATPDRKKSLASFIEEDYLPFKRSQGLWSTDEYGVILSRWGEDLLGLPLAKVTPGHIARALRRLQERQLAPSTIRMRLGRLSSVFAYAQTLRVVRENPVTPVQRLLARTDVRREVQVIEPEEAQRLLASSVGTPMELPVHLALVCGLRRGEVLGLRWQDVDFDAGTLSVVQTVRPDGQVKEPKTRAGRRTVPVPDFVLDVLRPHRGEPQELVYPGTDGRPMPVRSFWNRVEAWRKEAGVELRFHDLRHGFATLMGEAGEDLNLIKEMMGHSRVSVTADLYQRVIDRRKQRAANRLGDMLGGGR